MEVALPSCHIVGRGCSSELLVPDIALPHRGHLGCSKSAQPHKSLIGTFCFVHFAKGLIAVVFHSNLLLTKLFFHFVH